MYILQCNWKRITTSSDGIGAAGGFAAMSLKSGSTFQESNELFLLSLLLKSVLIFEKTQYKNWQKPTQTTDPHMEIYILLQIVVPNSVTGRIQTTGRRIIRFRIKVWQTTVQ